MVKFEVVILLLRWSNYCVGLKVKGYGIQTSFEQTSQSPEVTGVIVLSSQTITSEKQEQNTYTQLAVYATDNLCKQV